MASSTFAAANLTNKAATPTINLMPSASRTINTKQETINKKLNRTFLKSLRFNVSSLKFAPAFTLIELLVVIAIIGILATLGTFAYSDSQKKGRDTKRKSDLEAIKRAFELAKQDSAGAYAYPSCDSYSGLSPEFYCEINSTSTTPDLIPTSGTPYIKAVPIDPKTGTNSPFSSKYYSVMPTACTAATCTTFTLIACLENTKDPQKDATSFSQCTAGTVSYRVTNP